MSAERTPYRVGLVCLGNICRSPMAAVVLEDRVVAAGLADRVEVVSAGTGPWHVGEPMDARAADRLAKAGYDGSRHRGRQVSGDWFTDCDLLLAMDEENRRDLEAMRPSGSTTPVRMFRDLDPRGAGDVPDPFYGGDGGFDDVLAMVERTADALAQRLRADVGVAG